MGRSRLDLVEYIFGGPRSQEPVLLNSQGQGLDFDELVRAVDAAAAALRASFDSIDGCAVAVACEAPDAFLLGALAVLRANAVLVPMHPNASSSLTAQHAQAIGLAGTITHVTSEGAISITPASVALGRFDADIALVLLTSGSSGVPKRVQLRAAGLVHNVDAILEYLPVARWPRTGVLLPLAYSYGLVGQCFTTLRAGGTLVMLSDLGFSALQVKAMAEHCVQGLSSVPASLAHIARAVEDLESERRPDLRYLASAGGPLSPAVVELMRATFPQARLFNQYGLTEASPRVTAICDGEEPFARGSVGRPIAGVSVQAMRDERVCAAGEVGELVIRGPSVMKGYLGDDHASAKVLRPEGLRSGDFGYVDDEGYVFVGGRNDDLVNVAGERISTEAIAEVLQGLESVAAAFVVALPDAMLGHRLVALVEAEQEAIEGIRRAARSALTPARRPAKILCTRRLPRNQNGKLDRDRMRSWAETGRVNDDEQEE